MAAETVIYGVAPPGSKSGIVVCDTLGEARDLAELLPQAKVGKSLDGGRTWEEAEK